jgi:hypothetical protein
MSLQVALEKNLSQINFLESSIYDRYDLTNLIRKDEKFVVRQGDLIVTNYLISDKRKRGLRNAWLHECNRKDSNVASNIWVFGGNHFIIPLQEKTILVHPEHGIVIIPISMDKLMFYTFNEAKD